MSWSNSINEQGPIVQNKTGAGAGPSPWKRYHAPTGRFYTAQADDQGVTLPGNTRTFVRMWDSDTVEGVQKSPVPFAGWQRGEIIRHAQPAFVLTSLGPMWDPSNPATWRPNL
ncbi:MAG: hypothetical protein ACREMY_00075 [bacterium]